MSDLETNLDETIAALCISTTMGTCLTGLVYQLAFQWDTLPRVLFAIGVTVAAIGFFFVTFRRKQK